jgi:hypothetical protein
MANALASSAKITLVTAMNTCRQTKVLMNSLAIYTT